MKRMLGLVLLVEESGDRVGFGKKEATCEVID
jgi:hypothetical protein